MSVANALVREFKFTARDRAVLIWMLAVLCLSSLSVVFGLAEVRRQHATIQHLRDADQHDRVAKFSKQKSWGSAAYYSFHLTYDPPSDFAFAAMGQRDLQAWKHRIRMLALEGQIYERDVGNPNTALIGRFDFAFLAAFLVPLVLIMLLYDLRVNERAAGRYELLEATAGQVFCLWLMRACLRAIAVFLCLITPLIIAGLNAGAKPGTLIMASSYVFAYIALWTLLCYFISAWRKPGSVILMTLIGIWLSMAVILPSAARLVIDRLVPLPSGAEILMLQRETVNDAWDLPREVTMDAFFERHPEWSDYEEPVKTSFEWQWYYAFQQVGDQRTEPLTIAYREGRLQRDRVAAWVSVFAPPALLERALQVLARTDINSANAYAESVRAFHAELRAFYYPRFFRDEPFDKLALESLPNFSPPDFSPEIGH